MSYIVYCLNIYMDYSDIVANKETRIKKLIDYATMIENICKGNKQLYTNLKEAVQLYHKCYLLTKDESYLKKAKSLATDLLKYSPNNSDYWLLLFNLYPNTESNQYPLVLQALSLNVENETAWSALALHYYSHGNISECMRCLSELKRLNPLNEQLHLYQALIYYSLWIDSQNANQLEFAWEHVGEYLENCNSNVIGFILKGMIAVERKDYDNAHLFLKIAMETCERQGIEEWKWLEYKYIESVIKSGRYKDPKVILQKLHTEFKDKIQAEKITKELYNKDNIDFKQCNTEKEIKKLNALMIKDIMKLGKLEKCPKDILESIPAKLTSRAATLFLYLQFRIGMLNKDEKHSETCIDLITKATKGLIKNLNMSARPIRYLLYAELAFVKGDIGKAERYLKLLYMAKPEILLSHPKLLKRNYSINQSMREIKIERFRNPDRSDIYLKLIISLIQSGSKADIMAAIQFLSSNSSLSDKKLLLWKEIAEKVKGAYEGNIKEYTNDELGTLLQVYRFIITNQISPAANLDAYELMNSFISLSKDALTVVSILVKSIYLLHSFGYHDAVVTLSTTLLDILDEMYSRESEKEAGNVLCKALPKYSYMLIAAASCSLLRKNLNDKAREMIETVGFVLEKNSVPLNLLYIQSVNQKMIVNVFDNFDWKQTMKKPLLNNEKFIFDVYTVVRHLQVTDFAKFASGIETVYRMLKSIISEINQKYGSLPSYAKASVNALQGIYMMKMMVFLQEEKKRYMEEGKEADKIQKKMDECSKESLNKLKLAIIAYPDFEYSNVVRRIARKIKTIH